MRPLDGLAFGLSDEADMIDTLRRLGCGQLSLVTLNEEYIIGGAVFSPVFPRILRFAEPHEVRSSHSSCVR